MQEDESKLPDYQKFLKEFQANREYKQLNQHLGRLTTSEGYRFIDNTNSLDTTWKAVCFGKELGEIYVCQWSESSKKDHGRNWYKRWRGKKYIGFVLNYDGDFYEFMKHSPSDSNKRSTEYNVFVKLGVQIYYGQFKYDQRHSYEGTKVESQNAKGTTGEQAETVSVSYLVNGGRLNLMLKGCWFNGIKQGRFLEGTIRKEQKIISLQTFYFNDFKVSSLQGPKVLKAVRHPIDNFCSGITSAGVDSLQKDNCLYSECLDLFFKHMNSSFDQYPNRNRNMKAFTVFMFQKMIPSNKVGQNLSSINYQPFKLLGSIYKNTITIFEANPLILFPLNLHQSHFALGAIKTSLRKGGSDCSVDFQLLYFDSLFNTQKFVINYLKMYIQKEIQLNVTQQKKHSYREGLRNAKIVTYNNKQNKFSGQDNFVDCGVYVCIYGLLLSVENCLGNYQVSWSWDSKRIQLVRFFRQFIQEDANNCTQTFLQPLLNKLQQQQIIKRCDPAKQIARVG